MDIGKQFNQMSVEEYKFYIAKHKDYKDFNTLGLYRSICENEQLDLNAKIEIRDYANTFFQKTFDFLQLKDPDTYFNLITLGEEMTVADERQVWDDIIKNQQKILKDKQIKHRNFGDYAKHNCGYPDCPLNGLMVKKGSVFSERAMIFHSDKHKNGAKNKSKRQQKEKRDFKHGRYAEN